MHLVPQAPLLCNLQAESKLQRRPLPARGGGAAALAAAVGELTNRPYRLVGSGVATRFCLMAAGEDDAVLFLGMHHILRRAALRAWPPESSRFYCCPGAGAG